MAAAGQSIGGNKYITLLLLRIDNDWLLNVADDMKAFFEGLALNRSIQALEIDLSSMKT
jgi:hypothetical protein